MEMQLQNVFLNREKQTAKWQLAMSMSPVLEHQGPTSVQGEVFGEALLKQGYFRIIELEIQGTADTLLKEVENYLTSKTATDNFNRD